MAGELVLVIGVDVIACGSDCDGSKYACWDDIGASGIGGSKQSSCSTSEGALVDGKVSGSGTADGLISCCERDNKPLARLVII